MVHHKYPGITIQFYLFVIKRRHQQNVKSFQTSMLFISLIHLFITGSVLLDIEFPEGRGHTHTHAHKYARAHTHAHTRAHTRTRTRTHAHTYARTRTHTHTRTHAHTRALKRKGKKKKNIIKINCFIFNIDTCVVLTKVGVSTMETTSST